MNEKKDLLKELLKSHAQSYVLCDEIFKKFSEHNVVTVLSTVLTLLRSLYENVKEDQKMKEFILSELLDIIKQGKE